MRALPEHEHDHASDRGACSICYAWCLEALPRLFANPTYSVAIPRVFDKTTRTWKEARG